MINSLQIETKQKPKLSTSQWYLMELMKDCIKNKTVLTFEQLVQCYSIGVADEVYCVSNEMTKKLDGTASWCYQQKYFNVLEAYREQNHVWDKKIKGLIKSWFVGAIGCLVIKGQLLVLPVIEIE